ncbi:MAG: glycoside hydrolase family 2 protein [Bacilli bacterium]
MREIKHLNFNWLFSPSFNEQHLVHFDDAKGFIKVDLPHSPKDYGFNYLDEPVCLGKYTYKYCLNDAIANDKIYKLVFKGVAHEAQIYINDAHVAHHQGGYDEFWVDITASLNKEIPNWITVVVDDRENPDIPPFGGAMDYLGYGGIYREVQLVILNSAFFEEIILRSNEEGDGFIFKATIHGQTDQIKIEVKHDHDVIKSFLVKADNKEVHMEAKLMNLQLWDLNNPYLYDFYFSLIDEQAIVDNEHLRFGFRKIQFTTSGFYLNNQLIKLRGLNRHQSYPYVGYAMPKSAQELDAFILKKQLGVNIVRTSHYPASEHFLNACDELGLLVMEEIPGWQHIGKDAFQNNVLNNTKAMITRDRHHPSIILWGVRINESADHQVLYEATNKIAKQLDPTRPTGGVRNFGKSQMFEDVYTFNDFTHEGNKPALQKASKIKKNVPFLITEHNGHMFPTKPFDDEPHRLSQALRHEAVIKATASQSQVSGCIGWCMNDYQTHPQFGSGDKVCYHGVLDMFRIPKYAAWFYASQSDDQIVLEVLSELNYGDYPKSFLKNLYLATNCDDVKIYKDDDLIGEYHQNKANPFYKPLIKVSDFLGNILVEKHHFSKHDAKIIKQLFNQIQNNINLSFFFKIKMLYIMVKNHLTRQDATTLFYKLTSGANQWRFEGYVDNQMVKQVIKQKQTTSHWLISADHDVLYHEHTYDVVRIVVKKVDQNNHPLVYAFDPFTIETKGGIGIIGPNQRALISGQTAFWVRTKGLLSDGEVIVFNQQMHLTKLIKVEVLG